MHNRFYLYLDNNIDEWQYDTHNNNNDNDDQCITHSIISIVFFYFVSVDWYSKREGGRN